MKKDLKDKYDIIEGRNPVLEALKGSRTVAKLLAAKGLQGSARKIINLAENSGIKIEYIDRTELDRIADTSAHQGIMALTSRFRYTEGIKQLIDKAKENQEHPFIIVLDKIKDPHNLGAIIRTGHCCGAHGIVIPKKNAVSVTPTVVKASAGAVEHIPVVQVTNIARTLEEMKDMGLWIAGADMNGQIMYNVQLIGPLGLVIGNEGKGVSRLVKEKCDFTVRIPMKGSISSLNASVAAGVLMYEILRQREK